MDIASNGEELPITRDCIMWYQKSRFQPRHGEFFEICNEAKLSEPVSVESVRNKFFTRAALGNNLAERYASGIHKVARQATPNRAIPF